MKTKKENIIDTKSLFKIDPTSYEQWKGQEHTANGVLTQEVIEAAAKAWLERNQDIKEDDKE